MFERYTVDSRRILFLAREAARSVGAAEIQPVHLLVGALDVWPAAAALRESMRRQLHRAPGHLYPVPTEEVLISVAVKRLLATAATEADQLGDSRIRPEHILIALLEEPGLEGLLRDAGFLRSTLIESALQG